MWLNKYNRAHKCKKRKLLTKKGYCVLNNTV